MSSSVSLRGTAVAIVAFLVSCTLARAQAPASSLTDISQLLPSGQRIEVVKKDGPAVLGGFAGMSDAGLIVDVEGERIVVPGSAITEISRRGDSLKNGLVVGAASGLAGGLAFSLAWTGGNPEPDEGFADVAPGALAMGLASGVGLGLLFDGIREGKTVIFRAAPPRVSLLPMFGDRRKGVALSMRF